MAVHGAGYKIIRPDQQPKPPLSKKEREQLYYQQRKERRNQRPPGGKECIRLHAITVAVRRYTGTGHYYQTIILPDKYHVNNDTLCCPPFIPACPVLVGGRNVSGYRLAVIEGSGQRLMPTGFDRLGKDAVHVAVTWASINAPQLRSWMRGKPRGKRGLFTGGQDLVVWVVDEDMAKTGPSAGPTIALGLVLLLGDGKMVASGGVTGDLDLLGRLHVVGDIDRKVGVAKESGVKLLIIPARNYELEASKNFTTFGESRDYANTALKGADTMLEVMSIALQGEHPSR